MTPLTVAVALLPETSETASGQFSTALTVFRSSTDSALLLVRRDSACSRLPRPGCHPPKMWPDASAGVLDLRVKRLRASERDARESMRRPAAGDFGMLGADVLSADQEPCPVSDCSQQAEGMRWYLKNVRRGVEWMGQWKRAEVLG